MNPSYNYPAPYPRIAVSGQDPALAEKLTFFLAADQSEMTTVLQYEYDQWVLKHQFAPIARTISKIAVVEMHHLDIVAELIILLGGCPKFQVQRECQITLWNGGMIDYNQSLTEILKRNIGMEEMACEGYLSLGGETQDPKVAAMLKRLALDERRHVEIFNQILQMQK